MCLANGGHRGDFGNCTATASCEYIISRQTASNRSTMHMYWLCFDIFGIIFIYIPLFRIYQYICMDILCFGTILSLPMGAYLPTDGYAETIYCSTLGLHIMCGHMYDKILNRVMHMQ